MATFISPEVGGPQGVPRPQLAPTAPQGAPVVPQTSQTIISPEVGGPRLPSGETLPPEQLESAQAAQELGLFTGSLLEGENLGKRALIAGAILTTPDEEELGNILTRQFPDVISTSRDAAGNVFATNNKTGVRVVLNRPGVSRIDLLRFLGLAAAFTPAAGIAGLATGVAARAGLGAITAGLTQDVIETVQERLGGELNTEEVAFAAALGGTAEALVSGIQGFRAGRAATERVKAAGVEVGAAAETVAAAPQIKAAREAQEGLKEGTAPGMFFVGTPEREKAVFEIIEEGLKGGKDLKSVLGGVEVPLFPAQQTQIPSQLLKQRFLAFQDAGTKTATKALERQNKTAFDATVRLIDLVAPKKALIGGSFRFRTAAQEAIDARVQLRREGAGPKFTKALTKGARVDLKPVNKVIAGFLEDAPEVGASFKAMKRAQKLIKPTVGKPSLGRLQKAQKELGKMIASFGEGALDNSTKREVVLVKNALVKQMEKASPLFKEAQDEFKALSPAVTELEESIIGVVAKTSDVNLKSISQRIFDSAETNPQTIRLTRRVINKANPGAFNDLLRVEFQRRVGGLVGLLEDVPGELVGNTPGQLRRALFGNPKQREVLLAGMTREQKQNFGFLDDVLRRASLGRAVGSPTAPFTAIKEELQGISAKLVSLFLTPIAGGALGAATGAIGGLVPAALGGVVGAAMTAGLGKTALRRFGAGAFDDNVAAATELFFNPKWQPDLAKLRKMDPNSAQAGTFFEKILKAAGKAAIQPIQQVPRTAREN